MIAYSTEDFITHMNYLKADYTTYFFEVLLTDFYCLEKEIAAASVYITRSGNDGGIDSIIIPKDSSLGIKYIYCIQITTSGKDQSYLNDFMKVDPYMISQYSNILPDSKTVEVKRVLLSFETRNHYSAYADNIEIIDGSKLFDKILENSIRYRLLDKNKLLKVEYLENVLLREVLWKHLHRIKAYDTQVIISYLYFLTMNIDFIKDNNFDFLKNLDNVLNSSAEDLLGVFKKVNPAILDNLVNYNHDTLNLIVKVYKYSNNLNENILDLIFKLYTLKTQTNEFSELRFEPTKEYLSLYNKNNCICYMPYKFYANTKKSRFSFKCSFDIISQIKNNEIDKYMRDHRLVDTKTENIINKGLHHTGMSTTLINPSVDEDFHIIKELLSLSMS